MSNRKSLLAVITLFALVIGACGGTATPSGTLGPLSGDVRISGWSSSPTEDALLTDSINAFMAANPTVKVKWEPIAQDYETVLKTNLAAGTEADVFYADIFWIDSLMKTNKLLALDDLMAKSGTKKEDFVPSLINAFSYQGKTYGIPKDFNTLGLVYNKDLFKAAGVAEPTNDWTWTDLQTAAKKLTSGSVVGLSLPADAARFVPFLWQAGGDLPLHPDDARSVGRTRRCNGHARSPTSQRRRSLRGIGSPRRHRHDSRAHRTKTRASAPY